MCQSSAAGAVLCRRCTLQRPPSRLVCPTHRVDTDDDASDKASVKSRSDIPSEYRAAKTIQGAFRRYKVCGRGLGVAVSPMSPHWSQRRLTFRRLVFHHFNLQLQRHMSRERAAALIIQQSYRRYKNEARQRREREEAARIIQRRFRTLSRQPRHRGRSPGKSPS